MKILTDAILDYQIKVQKPGIADYIDVKISRNNKILIDHTLSNEKQTHDIVNRLSLRDSRFNVLTYELFRKKIKFMCYILNKFESFWLKKEIWDNNDKKGITDMFGLCCDFICELENELEAAN